LARLKAWKWRSASFRELRLRISRGRRDHAERRGIFSVKQISPEVFLVEPPIGRVGIEELAVLKSAAVTNPRRRARICAHPDNEDALHEMIISQAGKAYIRPHRHPGKSESFHIIDGRLTVVLFDDNGSVIKRVAMGAMGSGRVLFYRLSACIYHTVLFEDDITIFHEVTNGPFVPGDAEFAPWAPADDDLEAQQRFLALIGAQDAVGN
jgi:cupin fold WbuC family metalloprotein